LNISREGDSTASLGSREERLPDAGHPRTRGCCTGRGAPLAVPPGPLWEGARGTALTWTRRRGSWWPSPRCWQHLWSPRPIGKSVPSWRCGREAASAPAQPRGMVVPRRLPSLPSAPGRSNHPPCCPRPSARPHRPFQALNLVQREVEDAGQVVVGAPGGGEVALCRENKRARRCRAERCCPRPRHRHPPPRHHHAPSHRPTHNISKPQGE